MALGVELGLAVGVNVGVNVGVDVGVNVAVDVGVSEGVDVGVNVGVGVAASTTRRNNSSFTITKETLAPPGTSPLTVILEGTVPITPPPVPRAISL